MEGDGQGRRSRGLSRQEAAARLAAEGPNLLPRSESRTLLRIVAEILREPMFALLLGGGGRRLNSVDVLSRPGQAGFASMPRASAACENPI